MKKTIYGLFAAVLMLFGFAACNKDKTDTDSTPTDVTSIESQSNSSEESSESQSDNSEESSEGQSNSEESSESDGFGVDSNGNVDLPIIPW